MLWWSKVGYRKKRSCSTEKCLSGSRMPPLRRVTSCSPSASARTVTAHSLKAIGIRGGLEVERRERCSVKRLAAGYKPRRSRLCVPALFHGWVTTSEVVTYYAQSLKSTKYRCKAECFVVATFPRD